MDYKKQIEAWFAGKEQTLVDAVSRLVAIRSVRGESAPHAPFGPGPAAALAEALKLIGEWDLRPTDHDGYVGTADLNDQETVLHILAHLDVVDEGSGWTVTEPYAPKVVDGCIFGRGTDDDKGPAVAALMALKCVKELGVPLKRNVRVILGTDEESGSDDLRYYFSRNPFAPHSFTPDAGFPVINVEKGRYAPTFTRAWEEESALPRLAWFKGGVRVNVLPGDASCALEGFDTSDELRAAADAASARTGVTFTLSSEEGRVIIDAKGEAGHAAYPEGGSNALTALLDLLATLPLAGGGCQAVRDLNALFPHGDTAGKALGIAQADQVSGALTLTFSLLEITPTGLKGQFDARVPVCANEGNCSDIAAAALAARGMETEGVMRPPHHTPGDSPFVQTLLRRYEDYTGLKGECLITGGGTYVHDIPGGVAFGAYLPGFDSHLHGPDERACIDHLMVSAKIFAHVILDLCGAEA